MIQVSGLPPQTDRVNGHFDVAGAWRRADNSPFYEVYLQVQMYQYTVIHRWTYVLTKFEIAGTIPKMITRSGIFH